MGYMYFLYPGKTPYFAQGRTPVNIRQLYYFLEVLENNSIAAAARQIDIAQPALSQHISKLEHELKTSLFIRDHKGVQLTETGAKFEAHCRVIINQWEKAISDIGDVESAPQGKVVIAMNQATGNLLALPLFNEMEQYFPKIELDLRTGLSYEVIKLLKSGEADIAIAYEDSLDSNNFHRELLFCEQLYLVSQAPNTNKRKTKLPARKTITFADMAEHEIMITSIKESLGHLIQHYETQTGITLRKRAPFGQLMTGLRFAADGHSNLVLPSSAFYHLEESGQLYSRKIIEPEIHRNVYIATDANRPVRNVVLNIVKLIKQCALSAHTENKWRGKLPNSLLDIDKLAIK